MKKLSLFALALAIATSPLAFAKGGPPIDRIVDRLELSASQRDVIEPAIEAHRGTMESLRPQVREARKLLREAVRSESFDELAIRDAASALALLEAEVAVARGEFLAEMRSQLSAEQFEKLEAMGPRRGRRGGNRGKVGPRGGRGG